MNRTKLIEEYKRLARNNIRKKGFTKKDALKKIYKATSNLDKHGNRIQVRIYLPLSLGNCYFKLKEVKKWTEDKQNYQIY